MKDFDRLVQTSPNPLTRELLGAGLDDAPTPSAAPRIAAALGLSAGVAGASAPALAASGLGSGALAGGSSPLGVAVVVKWLGMGLLAGTVVSGGAALVRRNESVSRRPPIVESAETAHGRAKPERGERQSAETSPAAVAQATRPASTAPHATQSTPRSVPAAPAARAAVGTLPDQASALAHEVARIDEARVALRGGDAPRTLAALTRYDEERQTGVLDREAAVLRIEALRLDGKAREAEVHARRYLERFPSDAHSASLRELLREGADSQRIDR